MFKIPGVYRRFRFNEEVIQSPPAENAADNTSNDMRVDGTPPPEPQGRPQVYASEVIKKS